MTKKPSVFSVEMVKLSMLKPHPRNYVVHPQDELDHLMASIQATGIYRNIVTANDLTILAGHGVVQALDQLGYEKVPVRRLKIGPNTALALKVLTGDNMLPLMADRDDRLLTELLKDIAAAPGGLVGTGLDEMMLANLVFVTRNAKEIQDFDAAAHWVGLPGDVNGDQRIAVNVSFETEKDRSRFLKLIGIDPLTQRRAQGTGAYSIRWPARENNDFASVRFKERK